jgi:hypothetical protein
MLDAYVLSVTAHMVTLSFHFFLATIAPLPKLITYQIIMLIESVFDAKALYQAI